MLIKGSNYLETLSQVKAIVFDKTGTLTQGVFEVSGIHHNKLEDEKLLVLIKGSNYLETLSQVKAIVFDKTGTLTQGVFEVSGIHHNKLEDEKLLELAALAESASSHPISRSLQRAYGKPVDRSRVSDIQEHHNKLEDEKLLELAALAESASSHPISRSLQRAYGKPVDRSRVSDIQEISGNGVIAKVDGMEVAAGNDKLMKRLGIDFIPCHHVGTIIHMAVNGDYAGHIVISDVIKPHSKQGNDKLMKRLGIDFIPCHHVGTIIHMAVNGDYAGHIVISDVIKPHSKQAIHDLMKRLGIDFIPCHHVGTIIHMAVNGDYAGHIVISDVIKPHSKQAIHDLHRAGIQKTIMLTGDIDPVARQVADELGIDEVYSELLPADKVEKVEHLLQNNRPSGGKLAFVGDGINDAPVLSRADIGIAMGAMGSDAAIEAADVVLMDDDPLKIVKAVKISRKCLRIVYQNIVFAIGIKLICLVLGALGLANMWLAIFADVGVMILAVLNAIRALFVKNL